MRTGLPLPNFLTEFTLPRFREQADRHAFETESDAAKFAMRHFFLYFGVFVFAIHALLDIWVGGDATTALLLLRIAGTGGMFVIARLFHIHSGLAVSDSALISAYLAVGCLAVVGMTMVVDGAIAAAYPMGLIIILGFGGAVLSPSLRDTVVLCLAVYVTYSLSIRWAETPPLAFPVIGFFLTVGFAGIIIGALVRERLERLQVFAKWELEKANQRLETTGRDALAARDEALAARQSQARFIANMSHELRTPLNAINGFSEMIVMKTMGPIPEVYADYAVHIHNSGTNLLANVNDLLDMNRLSAGKMHWEDTEVDLYDMVRQAIVMCQTQADEAQVALVDASPRVDAAVLCDMARMTQVLTNLITNAIKFTEPGGGVTVTTTLLDDGGCEITVSDTGIGISEADLERIVRPFEQAEDGRVAKKKGGLGLGLAIVQGILDHAQCRLEMESELSIGTVAKVVLPESRISAAQVAQAVNG